MSPTQRAAISLVLASALSACVRTVPSALPTADAAYRLIGSGPQSVAPDYLIEAGDKLRVSVYQEPDLSADPALVDASGNVSLPLVGSLRAAGLTTTQLEGNVRRVLGERFLRNPQVTVAVTEAVQRTASVEGEVKQPGIYPVAPNDTLLTMLAQARSPTLTAKLNEVLVFRNVDGQRMGARFDIAMIRAGKAPDPRILPNDVIVVSYSRVLGAYRDILQTTPLFNVFTRF